MMITVGILLVMTVGLIYDADCRSLTACQRRLAWACEEAAFAAAAAEEGNEVSAAWDVLQKNLQVDGGGMPLKEDSPFEGPVRWQLTCSEERILLEADCGFFRAELPFLQKTAVIHTEKELVRNRVS